MDLWRPNYRAGTTAVSCFWGIRRGLSGNGGGSTGDFGKALWTMGNPRGETPKGLHWNWMTGRSDSALQSGAESHVGAGGYWCLTPVGLAMSLLR